MLVLSLAQALGAHHVAGSVVPEAKEFPSFPPRFTSVTRAKRAQVPDERRLDRETQAFRDQPLGFCK